MIYSFKNDYSEGCHESILNALAKTNDIQEYGYGEDSFCYEAKELIKKKINKYDSDVHFVSGGTQANLIIISSILRPYEAVISADTGHINVNETGAIEATGHKVCSVKTNNGKLTVDNIKNVLKNYHSEHMVKPKLVYISNTTELGTVYKKAELESIYNFCKDNNLYLHIDGARIGSAITSKYNDMTLSDIANLCDVFYIGGTKNGALLGEAIVINNDNLKENFRYYVKQRGALLAKGRIMGICFSELFKNNLFEELALHSNKMSYKIADAMKKLGYKFYAEVESNQIFVVMNNKTVEKLSKDYGITIQQTIDENNSLIRITTSFKTIEEKVDEFIEYLNNL